MVEPLNTMEKVIAAVPEHYSGGIVENITPKMAFAGRLHLTIGDISDENQLFLRTLDFVVSQIKLNNYNYMSTEDIKLVHVPFRSNGILTTDSVMLQKISWVLREKGFNALHGSFYCGHGPFDGIALYKHKEDMDKEIEERIRPRETKAEATNEPKPKMNYLRRAIKKIYGV